MYELFSFSMEISITQGQYSEALVQTPTSPGPQW